MFYQIAQIIMKDMSKNPKIVYKMGSVFTIFNYSFDHFITIKHTIYIFCGEQTLLEECIHIHFLHAAALLETLQ